MTVDTTLCKINDMLSIPYLHEQQLQFQSDLRWVCVVHTLQVLNDELLVFGQFGAIDDQAAFRIDFRQSFEEFQQLTQ